MHSQTGFLPELAPEGRGKLCVGAVLGALAQAAEHNLPLVPALKGLIKDYPLYRAGGRPAFWRARTLHLIADLETGQPLSAALARFAGSRLPAGFYEALRAAEAQDRIRAVLPVLVRCRKHALLGRTNWQVMFVYPLIQFVTASFVLTGLMIFIIPKFIQIFEEMGLSRLGAPGLVWLAAVSRAAGYLPPFFPFLFLTAMALWLFVVWLPHWPRLHAAWERTLFALPVIGPQVRQLPLLELAYGMAVLTAANRDVVQAAEWSRRASRSPWMRARLAFFIERVTAGENWADAWEETRLGTPLHDWIVRSAAAREKPTEGFQLLLEWLSEDLGRRANRIAAWVEPVFILCNACVIGSIVYSLWSTLFALIYLMSAL